MHYISQMQRPLQPDNRLTIWSFVPRSYTSLPTYASSKFTRPYICMYIYGYIYAHTNTCIYTREICNTYLKCRGHFSMTSIWPVLGVILTDLGNKRPPQPLPGSCKFVYMCILLFIFVYASITIIHVYVCMYMFNRHTLYKCMRVCNESILTLIPGFLVYVCAYICVHMYIHIQNIYIYTDVQMHIRLCCICLYIYMNRIYACKHMHTDTHICTQTQIWTEHTH
jgi:hypothetical protein